jgi:hypothetical protein
MNTAMRWRRAALRQPRLPGAATRRYCRVMFCGLTMLCSLLRAGAGCLARLAAFGLALRLIRP